MNLSDQDSLEIDQLRFYIVETSQLTPFQLSDPEQAMQNIVAKSAYEKYLTIDFVHTDKIGQEIILR